MKGPAALRTEEGLKRTFRINGHLQHKGIGHLDEGGYFFEGDRAIGVHESIIAYFHKSCWQDVLKETADEFHGIKGHSPQPMTMRFCVSKENNIVFHLDDAAIGDCHLEDIRGEVFEAGFGGTYRLVIDVPIDLPDFRGNLIEESGIFHGATKLGLKDFGEGSDREIKIDP